MRLLEAIWADAAKSTDGLVAELVRWTEEQRRVNVGLVTENAELRKKRGEELLDVLLARREQVPE